MSDIDTRTLDLFEMSVCRPSLDELVAQANEAIKCLIREGRPIVCGYSSGKDSSTMTNMALVCAAEMVKEGYKPIMIIMNGDTKIENPEIRELCVNEMKKMVIFGKKHGFRVITRVASPNLLSTFQVSILSGRVIPSFAGNKSDCTQSYKIQPQRRVRNEILSEFKAAGFPEAVVMIGTRFDESDLRALNMKMRGERHDTPVRNKDGDLVLSPIARFSTDDVFEYLGMVSAGLWDGYSDMTDVLRIYAHAGGTSCAVVSHDIAEAAKKKRKQSCTARTGCHLCMRVQDLSLKTLVEYDERYEYARPLTRLGDLFRKTRYDWARRNWIGRTIRKGYVAVEPDTYSPGFIRDVTRIMLQIDFDEQRRARAADERPKFELLPLEMKIAVDYLQNLNGIAPPFQLWADLRDIESGRLRYDIPDVPYFEPAAMPEPLFLYVGDEWEGGEGWNYGGFRDAFFEAMTEGSNCAPTLTELPGNVVWHLPTEKGFSIDPEAACFIACEFQDDILEIHENWKRHPQHYTAGFIWYTGLGTPTLDHSHQSKYDEVARRTEWKYKNGLLHDYNLDDLKSKCVRYSDLPPDARSAWSHKATTDGAQVDMDELFGVPDDIIEMMAV